MAKLTGDIIKAGLHIWVVGLDLNTQEETPLELIITSEKLLRGNSKVLQVARVSAKEHIHYDLYLPWTYEVQGIYLTDRGVRPYNYDNRPTQVFTTREECEAAIAEWVGRNPNFLEGE